LLPIRIVIIIIAEEQLHIKKRQGDLGDLEVRSNQRPQYCFAEHLSLVATAADTGIIVGRTNVSRFISPLTTDRNCIEFGDRNCIEFEGRSVNYQQKIISIELGGVTKFLSACMFVRPIH
jgi:hypothetical protein